jgi:hypothetical protein
MWLSVREHLSSVGEALGLIPSTVCVCVCVCVCFIHTAYISMYTQYLNIVEQIHSYRLDLDFNPKTPFLFMYME